MSRAGNIDLTLGGEDRAFRLGIRELRLVQEKCDAGPGEICARLAPFLMLRDGKLPLHQAVGMGRLGAWRVDDVREPILQGLIGAGMEPGEAGLLVKTWVDARPLAENLITAYQIVMAAIIGVEDEDAAGEREGERTSRRSPGASSGSAAAASTPSAPASASRRRKSTR